MPQISISLRPTEHAWLQEHASRAGVTPQAFVRALVAHAAAAHARGDDRSPAYIEAVRLARQGLTLEDVSPEAAREVQPGQQRGYDADDYRAAYEEAGTISGAARILGVHRKTVQEMLSGLGLR
ncbi:MAG: hypothetical protein KatS3mg051_2089 [Anaerolineae bacterium]|nr:MAG: hypothetical protein KatS3mg051_2089 [Anaerolineae bacterium]